MLKCYANSFAVRLTAMLLAMFHGYDHSLWPRPPYEAKGGRRPGLPPLAVVTGMLNTACRCVESIIFYAADFIAACKVGYKFPSYCLISG